MATKKLLFVDDEQEILDILIDLFSDDQYDLHTAKRVDEAMHILDEYPIDFVLSDYRLPDAPGSELLDTIRNNNPDTVRVLTSGLMDLKFGRVVENQLDGTLYLSKPWDLAKIKQLVVEKLG